MDVISFGSLYESCLRLQAQDKLDAAWTSMIAAQGQVKDMRKNLKGWLQVLHGYGVQTSKGAKAFIKRFGKGV